MQQPSDTPSRAAACSVGELFRRAELSLPAEVDPETSLEGFEDDSRKVKNDFLFVAVAGPEADGHRFIAQALKSGARFVVAERIPNDIAPALLGVKAGDFQMPLSELKAEEGELLAVGKVILVHETQFLLGRLAHAFWGMPSRFLQVVGVTGTNGKTTTVYLVEAALRNLRRYPTLFSTVEYRLGGEKREAPNTTPGALDLARLMALALERDADSVVMEVSSHALDQGRVEGIEFDAALMTNLTQDHLDYHKTMEEYAKTKRLLFTRCAPRTAVFNLDDPTSREFAQAHEGAKLTHSLDPESAANIAPSTLHIGANGIEMSIRFRLLAGEKTLPLRSPLRGRFNASNLLGAIALCVALGIKPEQAVAALNGAAGAPGRFETVEAGQSFTIFVDYAHTPDAVELLLENVREYTSGRVIGVLGCGGDRDPAKRPIMGAALGRLTDYAVITNDNPRTEAPEKIAEAVEQGILKTASADTYEVCLDRREAIRRAIARARPGDAVVIAGKGHETYQEVMGKRSHFDDRETARELCREALQKRSARPNQ